MNKKFRVLWSYALSMALFLLMFILSCTPEEVAVEEDGIGQFISFEIDGQFYRWEESDSVTFMPVIGYSYSSDNPDSIVLNYFMKLSKAHSSGNGAYWYEAIDIVFNQKWLESETLKAPYGCRLLPTGKYHELFSPGYWNCIGWVCEPHLKDRDVYLGMTMLVKDSLVSGSSAWDFLCDEEPLDQSGAFFRITSSQEKADPQRGIHKLLQGEFEWKVYLGKEMLHLKNGQFKIAMQECN